MRNIAWVAAFALLSVGVITEPLAQGEAPPAEGQLPELPQPVPPAEGQLPELQPGPPQSPPLGDARCLDGQEPPCYLSVQHYDNLGSRIEALRAEIAELRRRSEEAQAAEKQARDEGNEERVGEMEAAQSVLAEKIGELTSELRRLSDQLLAQTVSPSWAGWKWGVSLRSGGALATGSPERAVPIQAEGNLRWVSATHLSLEAALALGGWQTEDIFPLALTTRLAGVASWREGGFFVGTEVSVLQGYNREPAILLVTLPIGGELRLGDSPWLIRAAVAPTLHSEWARTSGQPWLLGWIGYSP